MSRQQLLKSIDAWVLKDKKNSENWFLLGEIRQKFVNFLTLPKLLETCFIIVNLDFDGKVNHFYYFLKANDFWTKIPQTGHSDNKVN